MAEYSIRVRGTTYLWGSQDAKAILDIPLALNIHVDKFGEEIELFKVKYANPMPVPVACGKLQPGGFFTVTLQDYSGVYATCALNTTVKCSLVATRPEAP